jgi:hypothetical protein
MNPFTLPAFRAICETVPYRPKSIFYAELYLFLRECSRRFVEVVIETGVKHGGSTALLADAFDGPVFSIDQRFLASFLAQAPSRVRLVEGDARVEVPRLLAGELADRRIGILIDGPKGEAALRLQAVCWARPCVQVVAIHDLPMGHGEHQHSHDETFQTYYAPAFGHLVPPAMAAKYPHGPGLALWSRG